MVGLRKRIVRSVWKASLTLPLFICAYLSVVRLAGQIIIPTDVSSLWATPSPQSHYTPDHLQRVLKGLLFLDPLSLDHATLLCRSLTETEDREARQAARWAIAIGAANPEAWMVSGKFALKQGNLVEGLGLMQRAVILDPDRFVSRMEAGLAYFENLSSLPNSNRELYRNLSELNLRRSVALAPALSTNPHLCLVMAAIRAERGDRKDAVRWVKRVRIENPIDWALIVKKLAVCFSFGEYVEAISTWKGLEVLNISQAEMKQIENEIEKHETIVDLAYIRADLHARKGDLLAAQRDLANLIATRPNVPEYRLKLGNVLEKLGRHGEAAASYEKALNLSPAGLEARAKLLERMAKPTMESP